MASTTQNSRELKTIGYLAAIESALFLSGFLTVFSPLPLIFGYKRHGLRAAIGISCFSAFMIFGISYLLDPKTGDSSLSVTSTALTLMGLTYLGFSIGYGLRSKWKFSRLLVQPIVSLTLYVLGFVLLYYFVFKDGFGSLFNDLVVFSQMLKEQVAAAAGTTNMKGFAENISEMEPKALAAIFLREVPLFMFWGIALVTWILVHTGVYYQLIKEWKKLGQKEMPLQFETKGGEPPVVKVPRNLKPWINLWKETFYWRLPDKFIYPFLASGILTLMVHTEPTKTVLLVLFKALGTFYCFQGLSLARFCLEYFRVPGFLRIGFYLLVVLVPGSIGFFILMGLGVLDFWANFRNKKLSLGEVK